ncbi:MAG: glycosyltransferase [Dictyoglomus sp.]|nr:glycosyltransferase [Dictyoglomus sp.]MCX7845812.1 glycosyltransferase [Dictyoglomaceae bacterium]MDW8187995.1 glycosyltransferase [Dictyoglomus sp.]
MVFPTLSVIIANYNYGKYIEEAIDSVINQDFPKDEIELIVVDYGSNDDSIEKINKYKNIIKIFLQKVTYIDAINKGISLAKGKYIAFLGSDDKWKREKSKLQVEYLDKEKDIGLIYSDLTLIDEKGRELYSSFWKWQRITPYKGYVLDKLIVGNFISGGTIMVRSKDKNLFYPIPKSKGFDRCEDWWIAFNIARRYKVDYIPLQLTLYRMHDKNMVLQDFKYKNIYIKNIISELNEDIKRRETMISIILEDKNCYLSEKKIHLLINYNKKTKFKKEILESNRKNLLKKLILYFKNYKNFIEIENYLIIFKVVILRLNPKLYNKLRKFKFKLFNP